MKKVLLVVISIMLCLGLVSCAKMVDDVTDMAGDNQTNQNGTDTQNGNQITDDNSSNQNSDVTDTMPETQAKITKEKAEEIALNHANAKREDVQFMKNELDTDNGKLEYDIEFTYQGKEYDYEIDANTGSVLNFDSEMAD